MEEGRERERESRGEGARRERYKNRRKRGWGRRWDEKRVEEGGGRKERQ